MPKTKVEVYDKDQLIYPFIESDHVTFSNGMKVTEMLDQSISMPTVTHEDLSFKVGVGDQDVSSAIVDSSVSKMTIKGKTYQNILPEPSTHVLTNNKEMFKVNEGLDPNVEIVDGVSKSAILSGQTKYRDEDGDVHDSFVQIPNEGNLYKGTRDFNTTYWEFGAGAKPLEPFELDPNFKQATLTSDYQHLTTPTSKQGFMFNDPNKTWTISAMFKGSQEGQTIGITLDAGRVEYDKKPVINGQWTRITWTFQGSTTLQKFRFENKSLRGEIKVAQVMVTETDHAVDWKPALRDGEYKSLELISCKMPVLTTTGKNLATVSNVRLEGIRSNSGGHPNNIIMKNIPVEEGKTYTISGVGSKSDNMNGISFTRYEHQNPTNSNNHSQLWNEIGRDDANTTFTIPKGIKYVSFTFGNCVYNNNREDGWLQWDSIQLEEGSTATSYEPHKSNILSTPEEVVLRSLPNGVCDTLNLMTGEYIQRIGEVVLDGTQNWTLKTGNWEFENTFGFITTISDMINTTQSHPAHSNGNSLVCSHFPSYGGNSLSNNALPNDIEMIGIDLNRLLGLRITKTKLSTPNAEGLKTWLRDNPVTVQYELATPIIKTVDLSSSGNWEKIVLDGSEEWRADEDHYCFCLNLQINSVCAFTDSIPVLPKKTYSLPSHASFSGARYFTVLIDGILNDPVKLKQYLSQNPMTVWYQTETHKDSTQIKQPIFFKNGHIIQSSGANSSLIPTLDYQVKTSNSYVMDLMKTGTTYTMKASGVSGTATIGNAGAFTLNTNRTFTSPASQSLFDNKLLVIKGSATDLMIIEGDVTSKTIPYFKGIKSAFEGEDKIEVLSTGKNLFDGELFKGYFYGSIGSVHAIRKSERAYYTNTHRVKPNTRYIISFIGKTERNFVYCRQLDKNGVSLNETSQNFANNYMGVNTVDNCCSIILCTHSDYEFAEPPLFQIEESSQVTTYKPHKSNNTKIPLLSPLRSLPNGVCDELIIDRTKKKATLIQRVGYTELNGDDSEQWGVDIQKNSRSGFVTRKQYNQKVAGGQNAIVAEHLLAIDDNGRKYDLDYTITMGNIPTYPFVITIPSHIINERGDSFTTIDNAVSKFKRWLSKAPISVVYQLETPVVTEVDLEGFPYIYKDGHIFLNSKIIPTTEIVYSINQCQQISASNEDIIRHEKELTYLQKLIAQYVQVDYESALLSLKV